MTVSTKKMAFISVLYVLILVLSNFCGVLLPSLINKIGSFSFDGDEWIRFLKSNQFIQLIQLFAFIFVIILCLCYIFFSGEKIERRYINLPFAFSAFGVLGWLVYLIIGFFLFDFAVKKGYKVNFETIIVTSFMNVLQAIVSFSLSYFLCTTVHKRYVLPKLYPNGNISKIKGVKQLSIKFLFSINYISIALFPVVFLLFYYNANSVSKSLSLIVLCCIVIIGMIITKGLTSTFEKPLKKIKKRIVQIKEGDYSTHINVVSNDFFGELADTLNDMTDSID